MKPISLFLFLLPVPLSFAAESAAVPVSTLVNEIASSNPELAFYEAELAASRSVARSATALNDPELSLDAGRKRVRAADGTLAGEGAAWTVSLTQTFEWPGRLALRKSIANRQVALAELGLARFRSALTARAAQLAHGVYAANAKSEAIHEVAERFTALKETFLARDPAGLTPLLETRVIEAAELTLQRRATEAELALQAALLELNQLRGTAVDAPLRVAAAPLEFRDTPDRMSLLTAARANNFDYQIRRTELEQQGFAVQLAQNERYPSVSVRPFFSQEKAGDRETTVGLGVSLPIPVSGRSRSAVETAQSRQRQAEAAALVAQRNLEREVLTAAQTYQAKVAETRRSSAATLASYRDAAALADRHYRLGAVPIATYVELQKSYLDAVEALLDTQQEALAVGLQLQQLTGLELGPIAAQP